MNYDKHYKLLISRAKTRTLNQHTETHHIVPRCMKGNNEVDNLAELTPEEHYLAHLLLCKMYPTNHRLYMAAMMMCANRKSNKVYGWLRRKHALSMSISQSGIHNSQFGTCWINKNEKSIKIKNKQITTFLEDGWEKGRIKKEKSVHKITPTGIQSDKYNWILEQESAILAEFDTHGSINLILLKRGFKNREGNKILSIWLKSKGRIPLRRRNSAEVA